MTEDELLTEIKIYFKENIFDVHKQNSLKKNASLKSYKINPILIKYLSKILEDNFTPEGFAKALYYPRVLGTSINTAFGDRIQKMFVEIGIAAPSLLDGMDIEYIDKIDGYKKLCQLKAGPNTINSDDVSPIIQKFDKIVNRARTNNERINNSDLVLGVLYGDYSQISQHYRNINDKYPVIVGTEFWHRITGFPNFYNKLVKELDAMILEFKTDDFITKGCAKLAEEIRLSGLLNT